ncbi:uncharacterized protein isoform X4 [Rhodnius prolixus]|uniref:uncharacterized protein isoform X4 n=1 Tax=Rhodnius prolixus TaxID=13249 RepID=UPI003D1897EC
MLGLSIKSIVNNFISHELINYLTLEMLNAGEPVLVCPYNKAHSIIKSRMQFHLVKCRLQSPNSEKVVCPFDSTHIVPKVELEFHQQICENRIVLDSFVYDVGSSKCPVEDVPADVPPEALAPCEENWDEDPAVSVLNVVKESAKEKKVLLNLIGVPKAERKAHRVQERLRFQRVADEKETEKASKGPEPNDVLEEKSADCNKNSEDDFEVVKSHKKAQGKKNKKSQQNVRRPPAQVAKISSKGMEELNHMTLMVNLNNDNNENTRGGGHAEVSERRPEMKIMKNAWEKPLNMGIRGKDTSPVCPIDDFPSLPVSGRGRGLKKF